MRNIAQTVRGMRDFSDAAFRRAIALSMIAPANATPSVVAAVESWLDVIAPGALADELDAASTVVDLRPRIGELRMPVVLRTGELDAAVPMPYAEELLAGIAGAELQRVPGCGHALLLEDEAATIRAIKMAMAGAQVS